MSGHLTIVSCGLGPDDLTARHREAVTRADVLAGGERLLAWFPEFAGERVPVGAHALEVVDRVAAMAADRRVAVLASGDALFFGIARLFVGKVEAAALTVIPNVTAAQAALARLQVPWHAARFFSVHGRSGVLPWRTVLRAPVAVIYCDSTRPPATVARALITAHAASALRPAAVAEHLGGDQERVQRGTLAELANAESGGMSMLILCDADDGTSRIRPELPLGLADEVYEHERGLITHPEVRAIALSKLRLRPGVLWDLGAGTGSVSIEACCLCEGLHAYAVEAKPERCGMIRANAAQAGCADYEVVQNDILAAIPGLPAPDRVFVGGGGNELARIVARAFEVLRPAGALVAAAVLEESRSALAAALPDALHEAVEVSIRRSAPVGGGSLMRPHNPVCLFVFRKAPA